MRPHCRGGSFTATVIAMAVAGLSISIAEGAEFTVLLEDLISLPAGVTPQDLMLDSGWRRSVRHLIVGTLVIGEVTGVPNTFQELLEERHVTVDSVTFLEDGNTRKPTRRLLIETTIITGNPPLIETLKASPMIMLDGAASERKLEIAMKS